MGKAQTRAEKSTKRKPPPHAWAKGKSGNPRGLAVVPAAERERRALERREAKRLAREIELRRMDVTVLSREHATLAVTVLAEVAKRGESDDVRVRAAAELLNRGFGKASEMVLSANFNVNSDGPPPDFNALMGEFRAALQGAATPLTIEHDPHG